MQKTGTAGPLIVIDVVTCSSGISSKRMSMSAAESIAHAAVPHLTEAARVVGVPAHQRRHVEGHGEATTAAPEDHLVALVGLLRVAEPGELPDRPGAAAVAGRVEPAGVGELPRPLRVVGAVRRLDLHPGERGEVGVADLTGLECPVVPLLPALACVHASNSRTSY